MRVSAKTKNRGKKSRLKLFRELGECECKNCGRRDACIAYQYVTRTGNQRWVIHCINCKQPRAEAEARRK